MGGLDLVDLRGQFERLLRAGQELETLASVGGNMLFLFPGAATWSIITSGPNTGLHEHDDLDEPVHFLLVCDPSLVDQVFGGPGADLAPYIAADRLILEGDAEVFKRFLRLAQTHNVVSLMAFRNGGARY